MRRTIILLAAVALGAAPAAAQNNAVDANAVAVNNEIAADPNLTAPAPVDDFGTAEMPGPLESETTFEEEIPVTGDRDGGFPWGLIGLIGLVGLLGRSRR